MASRLKLQEEFEELMRSKSVFYNPPATVRLPRPCIVYSLSGISAKRADNINYNSINRYKVTVVTPDPDDDMHEQILAHFKMATFDTSYVAENLYHRVITLYY